MPLSPDEKNKYKDLYIKTAKEYVQQLHEDLKKLAAGDETSDLIDSIHRGAHSLRGQSDMMGYTSMKELTSFLEKIFDAKKISKMLFSEEVLSTFEKSVKAMDECIASIETTGKESDIEQVIEDLQKYSKLVDYKSI